MTKIPTGRFVWFDYVSPDLKKAQGFFGELFNWKTQDVPSPSGPYAMIAVGDQTIGGYTTPPKGAPPAAMWLSSLQVQDAKATGELITANGGKVLKAAEKMGDFGTFGIVADPLGGVFALWQPVNVQGNGDYRETPNTFCWNELFTQDVDKSVAFYTKIGGFTHDKMAMPNGDYHILNSDGKGRAGVMKPQQPQLPQAWMPYVHVESVDQTLAKAKKLGAEVKMTDDVPGVGRIGVLSDPQGAWLGVLQPEPKK